MGHAIPSLSIAVACPDCKQVQTLSKREFVGGQMELRSPEMETQFCDIWLGCDSAGCKSPLPLYGQWSADTSAKDRLLDTKTWIWDGMRCHLGHAISIPEYEDE